MTVPTQLLRRYFEVEMTRDVDAIVELYAAEATFTTPDAVRRGHAEIRPFYEDAAHRFPTLNVEIVNAFGEGSWAVAEWAAVMSGPNAGEVTLNGVNVARFDGDKIIEVRSYYDTSSYLDTP